MLTLFWEKIISALAALNSTGLIPIYVSQRAAKTIFYVVFSAGTTAGVVTIEAAHDENFTGTWHSLGTVAWAAANRVHTFEVQHPYRALRARISTAVVGGTADVWAESFKQ